MLGERLRWQREAAGLTQDRLAELLCAAMGRSTFTRNEISRYERGVRTPSGPTLRALASILGVDLRELERARAGDERIAYAIEHPRRTDTSTLAALTAALAAQRRLEDAVGPAAVLPQARAQLVMAESLAAEAHGPVRRGLIGLASELCQFTGWLYEAVGQAAEAIRLLERAVVLGMEAADPDRTAAGLSYSAHLHLRGLRGGDPRRVVALNEAACGIRRVHPAQRVYLTYQRADSLALTGDRHQARSALRRAEGLTRRLDGDMPAHAYWTTPAFLLGNAAFVLDRLGERRAARQAAADSLAGLPAEWREASWAAHRRALAAG